MSKFTDSIRNTIRALLPDTRQEWIMFLFVAAGLLISAMTVWQLNETSPARWCALAEATSPENTTACVNILLAILNIKNNAIIGLLMILGLTVLSVVAVALGVGIKGAGPGGLSVDIGAKETTIENGQAEVTIPTPPSEDTK